MASKQVAKNSYTKTVISEGATTTYHQTVSVNLYQALEELAKEKNFDTVQSLVRFALADFVKKNGKTF